MIRVYFLLFIGLPRIFDKAAAQNYDLLTNMVKINNYPIRYRPQDTSIYLENKIEEPSETVDLKLYYECLCPDCIEIDRTQFKNVVNILSPRLNINTYPYGNARTTETNGKIQFKCQHGPKECYGNKLHACSISHIANHTQALLFNICMMEPNGNTRGSDNAAAARVRYYTTNTCMKNYKECASEMNVNVNIITRCAKGREGVLLLKKYGEESKKANFHYVPYVLINGLEWNGTDLMRDICAAFRNPPAVCSQ